MKEYNLLIRSANIPGYKSKQDIGIKKGHLSVIAQNITGTADHEIDADGCLVYPPLLMLIFTWMQF